MKSLSLNFKLLSEIFSSCSRLNTSGNKKQQTYLCLKKKTNILENTK